MSESTRSVERRAFLRSVGALTLGGAAGSLTLRVFGGPEAGALEDLAGSSTPPGTRVLVLVDMNGGNDDLSMLVPVDDPWYYDASYGHGGLAISPASVRPLAGISGYGLHPSLAWLASRANAAGDVAFVLGVGQTQTREFSHFVAEDNWRTCVVGSVEPTGFLGRFNDAVHGGSPVASVSLSGLHPSLVGRQVHVLGVPSVADFGVEASWQWEEDDAYWAAFAAMADQGLGGNLGAAANMIRQTLEAESVIRPAADPALNQGLEWGSLAWQMAQAAAMINAGVPCQTYVAHLGGFDTHDNQLTRQAEKLAEVDDALRVLFASLSPTRAEDVCVLLRSEFGRQVTANGSGGTDHGQAGTDILVGSPVTGGIYGEAPTLDPGGPTRPNRIWDARVPTTDFRRVFATVLTWLGKDSGLSEDVLGADYEELSVLSGGPPARVRLPAPSRRRQPA